ncbi:MAG: hypothetical protein GVY19_05675 [Bacteroidetes bacterium]|jgi:hypothetical protein|nr:hypothetical protein [Bacteroidota bacterium]
MKKIWSRISYLGLDGSDKSIDNRNLVLANQINFILFMLLLLYSLVFAIIREILNGEFTIYTQKLLYLAVFCLLNIFLASRIGNNGPKIPEKNLNMIFDPFFTTKEPGKGTGLGLSICYKLVTEHNGKLIAENTTEGVVFSIFLPK